MSKIDDENQSKAADKDPLASSSDEEVSNASSSDEDASKS